jgi:hypothetical protein
VADEPVPRKFPPAEEETDNDRQPVQGGLILFAFQIDLGNVNAGGGAGI